MMSSKTTSDVVLLINVYFFEKNDQTVFFPAIFFFINVLHKTYKKLYIGNGTVSHVSYFGLGQISSPVSSKCLLGFETGNKI